MERKVLTGVSSNNTSINIPTTVQLILYYLKDVGVDNDGQRKYYFYIEQGMMSRFVRACIM
jgi:hypothetical protein